MKRIKIKLPISKLRRSYNLRLLFRLAVLLFFAGADDASARLERDVFGSAAWKDWAATNAVLVRLDPFLRGGASSAQRALVARLAAQYGVKARPALVLLSPEGVEIVVG